MTFGDSLDGSHDLSIDASGTSFANGVVEFTGAVGSTAPLRSLSFESAATVVALNSLAIDGTGGSGPGLRLARLSATSI